jgi:hypothetical protein
MTSFDCPTRASALVAALVCALPVIGAGSGADVLTRMVASKCRRFRKSLCDRQQAGRRRMSAAEYVASAMAQGAQVRFEQ